MNADIVIVNYNAGDWLVRSVGSALRYTTARVSVVDNASIDSSIADLKRAFKEESRLEVIINAQNVGFATANNQILNNLENDYVVLMNPDCELKQDALDRIISIMQDNETIGLASCRILNADGSLQKTCKRRFPTPKTAGLRMLGMSRLFPQHDFDFGNKVSDSNSFEILEAVSGAFMVVRKSAMDKVGVLDEKYFMHCEDLDWCKRFALAGWDVAFVPSAEVVHAKGVSSKARPIRVLWNLHRGMDRFFTKFYIDTPWPLRYLVKIGIYLSFIVRAIVSRVFG